MKTLPRLVQTVLIMPLAIAISGCSGDDGGDKNGADDENNYEKCDDCDQYKESAETYKAYLEALVVDQPADGYGDFSWETTCADKVVESKAESYFCATMISMCSYQKHYNECVDESCDDKSKLAVDCIE